MKFAALETGSPSLCLALFEDDRLVAETRETAVLQQSELLVPALNALLQAQGWRFSDLQGLACGLGPGSFTGLRVGLAFAEGAALAQGPGFRLAGIPSLLSRAEAARTGGPAPLLPVAVFLDAGRGLVYRAHYKKEDGIWQETLAAAMVDLAQAAAEIQGPMLLTGDLAEAPAFAQARHRGVLATPESRQASAAAVGRLAWKGWQLGAQAGPRLEPLYLRPSEAERKWQAPPSRA